MPEALAEAELGAALIDHALERFNQDWLQERATVREEELGQLRTDLGEALAADTAALGQERPCRPELSAPRWTSYSLSARFKGVAWGRPGPDPRPGGA